MFQWAVSRTPGQYAAMFGVWYVAFASPELRHPMKPYSVFNLADGRQISYSDRGSRNRDATVLLYFHNSGGSRLEPDVFGASKQLPTEDLVKADIRLISFDRDGIGESFTRPTLEKNYKVATMASDMVEFTRSNQMSHFNTIGFGAGGPFALACGQLRGCDSVTLISSDKPVIGEKAELQRRGAQFRRWLRGLPVHDFNFVSQFFMKFLRILAYDWPRTYFFIIKNFGFGLPTDNADRVALKKVVKAEYWDEFFANIRECFRQGVCPILEDFRIAGYKDWGFDLDRVGCPVRIHHGAKDKVIDAKYAEWYTQHLPDAQLKLYPAEGHLSLPLNHFTDILLDIVNDSQQPSESETAVISE